MVSWIISQESQFGCSFWYILWDCPLQYCRGVKESLESFYYSFDGKNVFSLTVEDRTCLFVANQLAGLGGGHERVHRVHEVSFVFQSKGEVCLEHSTAFTKKCQQFPYDWGTLADKCRADLHSINHFCQI